MKTAPREAVKVTRRIPASPSRVFDAWLEPQMVAKWMFGEIGLGEEMLRAVVNPWVEKTFSLVSRAGSREVERAGRYLEVEPPRRLAFTWGSGAPNEDADRVSVDIAEEGGGSVVTVTHETRPEFARETAEGWGRLLEALEEILARMPAAA